MDANRPLAWRELEFCAVGSVLWNPSNDRKDILVEMVGEDSKSIPTCLLSVLSYYWMDDFLSDGFWYAGSVFTDNGRRRCGVGR